MNKLPTAKLIFFTGFLGFILLSVFLTRAIFAQDTTGTTGIQVSAPVYNFGIDPGGSAQEIVKVRNVSDSKKTFYPEVLDFKALGESGTPSFITGAEKESYTYSLASWVNISTEGLTLKPKESAALNFTINVPKDAEPGGRYAGILFGTVPPKTSGTGVAIANKVGALILVRVSGDAKELANLKEFSTPANFYENPPVDFAVRVENKGNVHFKPKGNIEIKDTFGRKVATLPVNAKDGNVLPESIRKFDKDSDDLTWKPGGFTIGKYTANVLLTYGDSGKQINGSISFWVIPWKILLVIGVGILILILLLILILKRYNRWVVSRAEKPSSRGPQAEEKENKESGSDTPPFQSPAQPITGR